MLFPTWESGQLEKGGGLDESGFVGNWLRNPPTLSPMADVWETLVQKDKSLNCSVEAQRLLRLEKGGPIFGQTRRQYQSLRSRTSWGVNLKKRTIFRNIVLAYLKDATSGN